MANGLWFALEIPAVEIDLIVGGNTLSVELDIPAIALSAGISQGEVLNLPLEVPAIEVSATIKSGEKLSASLPIPAIELSFLIGHINKLDAALDIPAIGLSFRIIHTKIDAALVIPALQLSASIKSGNIFNGELEIPVLQLSGTLISGVLSAELEIPALRLSGTFKTGNLVNAAINVPALELSGALISGGVLGGEIEIPALGLVLTLGHQNRLAFILDIPSIDPWLEIRGVPVITARGGPLRKAFVMNLAHFGVSEYENYFLNSICDYHGMEIYIGASEDGIFVLDGDDDAGVEIDATIAMGTEDLWAGVMKRLREGFISIRGGDVSLGLILDEGRLDPVMLNLEPVTKAIHERRFKIPRGLKNRFFNLLIKNIDGSDFDLESARIFVDPIQRRKR
jgi:hypothetical protein